jgi:hypothetical protein
LFRNHPAGPLDRDTQGILETMVNHAAFVRAMNDAWTLAAALTLPPSFACPSRAFACAEPRFGTHENSSSRRFNVPIRLGAFVRNERNPRSNPVRCASA